MHMYCYLALACAYAIAAPAAFIIFLHEFAEMGHPPVAGTPRHGIDRVAGTCPVGDAPHPRAPERRHGARARGRISGPDRAHRVARGACALRVPLRHYAASGGAPSSFGGSSGTSGVDPATVPASSSPVSAASDGTVLLESPFRQVIVAEFLGRVPIVTARPKPERGSVPPGSAES